MKLVTSSLDKSFDQKTIKSSKSKGKGLNRVISHEKLQAKNKHNIKDNSFLKEIKLKTYNNAVSSDTSYSIKIRDEGMNNHTTMNSARQIDHMQKCQNLSDFNRSYNSNLLRSTGFNDNFKVNLSSFQEKNRWIYNYGMNIKINNKNVSISSNSNQNSQQKVFAKNMHKRQKSQSLNYNNPFSNQQYSNEKESIADSQYSQMKNNSQIQKYGEKFKSSNLFESNSSIVQIDSMIETSVCEFMAKKKKKLSIAMTLPKSQNLQQKNRILDDAKQQNKHNSKESMSPMQSSTNNILTQITNNQLNIITQKESSCQNQSNLKNCLNREQQQLKISEPQSPIQGITHLMNSKSKKNLKQSSCLKVVCAQKNKQNQENNLLENQQINFSKEKKISKSNVNKGSIKQFSKLIQKKKLNNSDPIKQWSLNDFSLGRKIGKGRLGSVFMAQQKKSKFTCALKMLNIQQIKDQQMEQQIALEIKLQSFLNHPNILKLFGFFKDDQNIYLILQLADQSLFKKVRKQVKFTQNIVAYYAKQMIECMKYFHSENILHRDIKPENIMLSFDVLKLGDFGWSVYSPIYKRQTFCGTLDYVSPEIIKGQYYDQKVDIWSLGVLLYELSTGFPPFQTQSEIENQTFDKILESDLMFPDDISDELCDLISMILNPEPEKRISLNEIQNSQWMRSYQMQGRLISQEIFKQWKLLVDNR